MFQQARRRGFPYLVGVLGLLACVALAVLCRFVAEKNEDRLLQEQTDQAASVLTVSIAQLQAPLVGTARTAAATAGDADIFERIVAPLMTEEGGYSTLTLYDLESDRPVAQSGPQPQLLADGGPGPSPMLDAARRAPFAVIDLLAFDRTLGFAAVDDPSDPRYVVYAERVLSPDPNVRRRTDEPFAHIEYALYLGAEDPDHLLGSSLRDLPVDGRRATATVAWGDQELLVVTTPIGRLGGSLIADLWWIVLVVGIISITITVLLLRRLQRAQATAIALAVESSRKHLEQRDIAETLQLGLLPQRLRPPPGATLTARYWPAGEAALVGGDFYDAFRIDDDRWGIVIGDVCGRGIEAAALTSLVRHTIRTASRGGEAPVAVLRAVHGAMAEHEPSTFCTVCLLVYEPRVDVDVDIDVGPDGDGAADRVIGTLTVALAGHPQPLRMRRGRVETIGRPGTVLGMLEPLLEEQQVAIVDGDTVVLYTDGLTDAPSDQAVSTDELVDVVRTSAGLDTEQLADLIGDRKRARRPLGSSDDTALLVVRFERVPTDAPPASSAAATGSVPLGART